MRRHVVLITAVAVMVSVTACSPETMSMFFDGVPEASKKAEIAARGKKHGAAGTDAAVKSPMYSHGPYAAKLCDACHRPGGGGLIMPVEELCLNCHVLNIRRKHIHGPVASGGCRACHNPHGSGKPFLLQSEPTTFCFTCHDKTEVGSRQVHKDAEGVSCTDCHDPHGSDNNYLLRFAQ